MSNTSRASKKKSEASAAQLKNLRLEITKTRKVYNREREVVEKELPQFIKTLYSSIGFGY